jgi:3-oxoacyl-[acyl-carrier-protein] synthase-3
MTRRSVIVGTGSALPPRRVTNADLAAQGVDTTHEWIVERTGIEARHFAGDGETTATLATEAARKALEAAGVAADQVGLIVLATATPDQTFPASATRVQTALGIDDCIAFDVAAVCTGFLYALSVADNMLKGEMADYALVIGSETFSRILDFEDRATCVLFGDGAGRLAPEGRGGAGSRHPRHQAPRRRPPQRPAFRRRRRLHDRHGRQAADEGQEVFRHAVTNLVNVLNEVLTAAGHTADEVDWVVPHQANKRILDATAKKLGLDPNRVVVTVDQHANTSAASVPLALDVAVRDGRVKKDDLIVLEAMGGGFTWGAAVLRY